VSAILIALVFSFPWSLFNYTPPTDTDPFTGFMIIAAGSFGVLLPFVLISFVSKSSKTAPLIIGVILAVIIGSFLATLTLGINTSYFVIFVVFSIVLISLTRGSAQVIADGSVRAELAGRPRDPTIIQRVVVDTFNEEEMIIRGSDSDTFRTACRAHWNFSSIPRESSWILEDDRGNDISELKLTEYHGIAHLVSTNPMDSGEMYIQTSGEPKDKTDEYSDMDRGVEFYD
jgi:hypothetical protein